MQKIELPSQYLTIDSHCAIITILGNQITLPCSTDLLATSVSLLRTKMSQYVVYQTSLLLVTCHEQIGKKFRRQVKPRWGLSCNGLWGRPLTDTLLQIIIPRCYKDRFLHRLHFHAQLFPAVQFFGFSRNT